MANAPAPSPAPGAPGSTSAPVPGDADLTSKDKPTKDTTKKPKKATTKKPKAVKATGPAGTTAKVKKPTVRRKKPAAKSTTGAANQHALQAAAKAGHTDLAIGRANASYKRTDPLWYRIEDVLAGTKAQQESSLMAANSKVLPEQGQIVEAALAHNGMTRADVTPQAMACLLEQARRYAQELLEDAQDYAAHAGGLFRVEPGASNNPVFATGTMEPPIPSRADLLLASEMRPDHPMAVTAQLPRLNLLAQQVNMAPLPPIPSQCYSGIMLPSQEHTLMARTFDVVSGAHVAQKMIQGVPTAPNQNSSSAAKSSKPGYGAARGTQIPIVLKQVETTPTSTAPADSKPVPTTTTPTMMITSEPK